MSLEYLVEYVGGTWHLQVLHLVRSVVVLYSQSSPLTSSLAGICQFWLADHLHYDWHLEKFVMSTLLLMGRSSDKTFKITLST